MEKRYAPHRRRIVQKIMYLVATLLVAGAAAVVLVHGGSLRADAAAPEPAAVAAPAPTQAPVAPRWTIAIDPGHGGVNPAIGAEDNGSESDGVRENEITLRTARLLYDKLAADARFRPILTADGTAYLKPSQRAAAAKAAGADLLLSIHLNSNASGEVSGFECYAAPPALPYNAESVRFGRLLADAFGSLDLPLRGTDGVRYLYFTASGARAVTESTDTTPRSDPSFTVLEECGCPAVLAEEGFITSESDRALLCTETGCQQAAEAYYQCIVQFFAE